MTTGGVLGFWGGVGSMGTVFLLVVLTQRYCCRRRQDKDEAGERTLKLKLMSLQIKILRQLMSLVITGL